MKTSQGMPTGTAALKSTRVVADSNTLRGAILRAQAGDMDAFRFLYVRYSGDVLRHVRGLVRDQHEAEDITQNVFVKLISVIGKYEPREVPFAAWIMRVARNCALDHLRAARTLPCEDVVVPSDDGQVGHERRNDICRALDDIPREQREVIVLRHILGLSPVEIAGVLGKTESSVHGLHHRGRANLKGALVELEAKPVVAPSKAV